MSKNKLEIEGIMERSQVIAYLENLVEGLKAGSVHIQAGHETAVLTPPNIVDFEMEVGQKKEKSKISLEISWRTDGKGAIGNQITIGANKSEA